MLFSRLTAEATCTAAGSRVCAGGWKLTGFGFSSPLDYAAAPGQSVYDYSDSEPTLVQQATQVWYGMHFGAKCSAEWKHQ